MSDYTGIAQQFVQFYYQEFDRNRNNLEPLYRDHSMLTFEGNPFQGTKNIIEKLVSLPFQTVQHQITTMDAQPASINGTDIIVSVTGLLVVDGGQNPLQFSQTFHLLPDANTYYVFNDIFRLNYG